MCCQIKFNCGGSSGTVKAAYQYLKDLGYKCEYVEDYIDVDRLMTELYNGCPHLIGGLSSKGGHMWIIDGIRKNKGQIDFHCNWGYDGVGDSWSVGDPYTYKDPNTLEETRFSSSLCQIYIDFVKVPDLGEAGEVAPLNP